MARAVDLCRSFAEWKAAQQDAPGFRRGGGGARGGGGDDAALLAALEHAGFGLRLPPPARRSQALYALPLDIALPQGCVSSLSSSVLCSFPTPQTKNHKISPCTPAVNAW